MTVMVPWLFFYSITSSLNIWCVDCRCNLERWNQLIILLILFKYFMVPSSWAVITLILWSFTLLHHQVEIYICMSFQKPNSSTVWSFKYAWALRSIGEPSLGCQIREVACAGLPESGIWCPFHEAKVLSCSFAPSKPCLATTSGLIRFHTHEHADICAFQLLHTLIPPCSHFSACVCNKLSLFCHMHTQQQLAMKAS